MIRLADLEELTTRVRKDRHSSTELTLDAIVSIRHVRRLTEKYGLLDETPEPTVEYTITEHSHQLCDVDPSIQD